MRGSTAGDKSLQQSMDSRGSGGQSASLRTTASSSTSSRTRKLSTLSTSLLFARQRSSDSSVLSSLQGDGCQSGMAETSPGDVPTIYPDTINPEFQASGSAGLSAAVKSPLAAPVVQREPLHVESLLFADLSSDYAIAAEESTAMPPNQTLDQMLAQDAKGTQQLLPLQQRQDAVLKVNDVADRVAAVHLTAPPPPAASPQHAHASSKRQSEESADDGSEDWDVVGSDQEDAETAHASHVVLSPIPGTAAYRMSTSGRVGSSSTRHLSSAGGGMSQYDEFASMDRVPRFNTGEPQYTYGDGGGPPPADSKFYKSVMVNLDDVIEVDTPTWRAHPRPQQTPQHQAHDDEDEDEDDSSEVSESDSNEDSEALTLQNSPSPTPRVLLPSPMQDRASRAAATAHSAAHVHTIATATISSIASMPPGAATATLDTSGDIMSHSKLLTSKDSSVGNSSQIPSSPQQESHSNTHLHSQPRQLHMLARPAASSEPASERRRTTPTQDHLQSTGAGFGASGGVHASALSPLHSGTALGLLPPRATNGGAGAVTDTKMRSFMPSSSAVLMGSSRWERPPASQQGRPGSSTGPPQFSRRLYQEPRRDHRAAYADQPFSRAVQVMGIKPLHVPGLDRKSTLEYHTRSASMDPREPDRIRAQVNASAHSASLASTQTPDSVMSMHGSDAFPVQVLEPSPHEWPLDGGQHSSQQQAYAAGRRRSVEYHPTHHQFQNAQQWASDGNLAQRQGSFVSSTAGLLDIRSGAPSSSFQGSSTHHRSSDCRHTAYPGMKVDRWQQLTRQSQLVQQQMKREMHLMESLRGDPLAQFQFHIPLFAAMWGIVRESVIVPHLFKRAYKEVLGATVSRGNLSCFCTSWHSATTNEFEAVGMHEAWHKSTMAHLAVCPKRFKALLLWFRDASHLQFFTEPNAVPAPFTVEEAAEVIAVAFMHNMLNRVTLAHLSDHEALPMLGMFRPLMQIFPNVHAAMFKSLFKSGESKALPGRSSEVRPSGRHSLGSSLKWAAPLPHIADALSYLESVVNYHLRGRFLPIDLCDKFMMWMDQQYHGISRERDHVDSSLQYAAKDAYPDDPQRQDAMLYMLLVACSPVKAGVRMNKVLRGRGWRHSQIQAMAPFAAFHSARITALWQSSVQCVSQAEAEDDALWTVNMPDGEAHFF